MPGVEIPVFDREDVFRMKQNLRVILFLTIMGFIGGMAVLPYQMSVGGDHAADLPVPLSALYVIKGLDTAFQAFVLGSLGFMMAGKVNLGMPVLKSWLYRLPRQPLDHKWLTLSVAGGMLLTLTLVLFDRWVFLRHIPELADIPAVEWWKGLLTMFYGGIFEEIVTRLFVMTLIVWILAKLFSRNRNPSDFYWIVIISAALLFGIAHLPLAQEVFGPLTPAVIVRTLFANGLLGIFFGYLYWKKGLEYAMISHMTADVMLHVVLVRLF
jgi:hypothetical protein